MVLVRETVEKHGGLNEHELAAEIDTVRARASAEQDVAAVEWVADCLRQPERQYDESGRRVTVLRLGAMWCADRITCRTAVSPPSRARGTYDSIYISYGGRGL